MGAGSLIVVPAPFLLAETVDGDCERVVGGLLGQPVNTVTSLAFVVAGVAIAAGGRAPHAGRAAFAGLVAATGIGSVIEHGPNPLGADLAHDLPLVALIAYLATDAASDLAGRRLPARYWVVPPLALVPVIVAAPALGDAVQVVLAVIAIALSLERARRRPELRATILTTLALLGVGSVVGTLSRGGWPLCRPDSLFQGHAVWHLLAAAAMWWLAPAVGRVGPRAAGPR